jgi:hypothetical protein
MIKPNVVNAIYLVWIVQVLTKKIVWNVIRIDTIKPITHVSVRPRIIMRIISLNAENVTFRVSSVPALLNLTVSLVSPIAIKQMDSVHVILDIF